ncbi:hypothetical protein ACFOWT_06465 [Croceibacterium xixiisoli]|nr:hypothetical protein [Croceibacterium xixiisoli]
MTAERAIFDRPDQEDADSQADIEADAEDRAGKVVDHAEVAA